MAFLNRTYLTLWIEDIYVDTVNTEESVGYGTTCIARSCYEYVHTSLCRSRCRTNVFTALLEEILEQTRHETCTYVLECECRTMEEFEGVDIVGNRYDRTVELQCVIDNLLQ